MSGTLPTQPSGQARSPPGASCVQVLWRSVFSCPQQPSTHDTRRPSPPRKRTQRKTEKICKNIKFSDMQRKVRLQSGNLDSCFLRKKWSVPQALALPSKTRCRGGGQEMMRTPVLCTFIRVILLDAFVSVFVFMQRPDPGGVDSPIQPPGTSAAHRWRGGARRRRGRPQAKYTLCGGLPPLPACNAGV